MGKVTVKKIGKVMIKVMNSIVDITVLTVILMLIAVACYALWDSGQVYQAASTKSFALFKPSEEGGSISFAELQSINPEVFSWLTVYDTNIDYPVTQSNDNAKYVNTNAFGDYSLSGAIFLDYLNSNDFQDFNSILYGHHMEKQAMFGELGSFSSKSYFDSHLYGNLFYDQKDHGLEFFAFIKTDAYDGSIFAPRVQGQEAQQAYLQYIRDKAMYLRDIEITIDDHLLLLTTCSSEATNGRDVLVARITAEHYENELDNDELNQNTKPKSVDQQTNLWASLPMWQKILLSIILLLFVLLIICAINRKRVKE